MATATKARPKKGTAKPKAPAKKPAAKKTQKTDTKPKAPAVLFEVGDFVKFNGYRTDVSKDEAAFEKDETLYLIEVDEQEDGVLYTAIIASDISEYETNGDENVRGGQVAPSEVSQIKGAALEKARDTYMPVVRTGKLAELLDETDDPIEVAVNLNHTIQETYFWLGGALAIILQQGSYLKENGGSYEGEDAFNDFCQDEFGFKASKGRDLARVYRTFSQIDGFDPASLDAVGWSKAAIAERFVTEDNVEEVIEIATDTTQRELAATLKEKYVSESGTTGSGRAASRGGNKLVTKTMSFRLDEDSAETVELAINQCMKQNGIENEALALERICLEWAQDHVEAKTAAKRIQTKGNKAKKAREAAAKKD
jgi:hypothetical protein